VPGSLQKRTEIDIFPRGQITTPDYLRHFSPAPPPENDPDEPPLRCVYFNREYVPFILAVLDYWCHSDQFSGNEEARNLAALRFETLRVMFMMNSEECGEGTVLQLRQNSFNACLLEYSTDAGSTWQTAFDYGKCARKNVSIDLTWEQLGDQYITNQTTMNTYNGDINNVAPEWQYGDPDDEWRDMAMCWAAEKWVELIADLAIEAGYASVEERKDKMFWVSRAFDTLGDVASAAAELGIYKAQAEILALVSEIASTLVTIAANLQSFDPSALSDQDAQSEVACTIYGALQGAKPTFAAWSTTLAAHGLLGNADQIADAAYLMMQSEELYVQFLMFAADIVPAAELAGDLGCPCNVEWEEIVDLTLATLPDYLTVDWGSHQNQLGVFVAPHQAQGYNQLSCHLTLTPYIANWTLTNVYAAYAELAWGDLPNNYTGILFTGTRLDPSEYYIAQDWLKSQIATGASSRETGVSVTGVNDVGIQLRVSKFAPSGQGRLTTLRLRGLGPNPFV
jgi:hypothetical protein